MSDPQPDEEQKKSSPDDDSSIKGDVVALGIGCLVVLIFLAALVMVAMNRE